ncbi:MAG: S1 RNA-binding domain-containing protein [Candidatus Omnitrophica bacterium]|nr:S1 RNA-binding domain-containing protein [Candidatus Omnitrophota bacterium]
METEFKIGDVVEAEITKITDFGAFVKINGQDSGLIHISQISNDFVKDITQYLKVGDRVKARVFKLGPGKKIDLTLKKATSERPQQKNNFGFKSSDFEEKLKKFLQQSQQSLTQVKKRTEKYHR